MGIERSVGIIYGFTIDEHLDWETLANIQEAYENIEALSIFDLDKTVVGIPVVSGVSYKDQISTFSVPSEELINEILEAAKMLSFECTESDLNFHFYDHYF